MSQVEEQPECPLCMEMLEVDDLNFFPCTCGYQICRFCWHRIRTDENGLCPACRKAYPENPADFKPLSQEQVVKMKAEKRHKEQQRKQKATESRKHLANVRVVQKNLVFVVGLPMRLADTQMLKRNEYFGKFGRIHKVVINQSTTYAGSMGPSASAYVTYSRCDDALRAIEAVNNISVDSRVLKTSLGTTKYCSHFIKSQSCPKPDCMYLHDFGDSEASFTKEEMQQGKHQEYEKKLHEQLNLFGTVERKTASPPQGPKQETWPSLNINVVPVEPESKPVPAPPPQQQATGKGKRHGKDKASQDKGKQRKGKEKADKTENALGTSQSESCIPSSRNQSNNHTSRSSLIFDDPSSFYSIATNSSNSGEEMKQLNNYEEDTSPPDSPDDVDNNWDSKPGSPVGTDTEPPTTTTTLINNINNSHHTSREESNNSVITHNGYHELEVSVPVPPSTHNGYHGVVAPSSQSPSSRSSLPTPPSPQQLLLDDEMPDDELDFDPFQETQKGLADLLEKELALQQKVAEAKAAAAAASASHNSLPSSLYLHSYQHHNQPPPPLDPAILSHLHSNQHRVAPTNNMDRRPLPPPGFGSPMPQVPQSLSHTHPHMDLYNRGMNGTKPTQSYYYPNGNGVSKFSDWPESLRSLVHDNTHLHHHTQHQHSPQTSYHRPDKVWNAPSSFADWTTLDPAIVSSSRPHHLGINVHSPPPLYNQGMSGINGSAVSMNCLGPNLSYRYQDAYFKTHIHNTSVPPPGFSLLHQSGNGLKQSLSSGIETMD